MTIPTFVTKDNSETLGDGLQTRGGLTEYGVFWLDQKCDAEKNRLNKILRQVIRPS
jgi:hypothetical protein